MGNFILLLAAFAFSISAQANCPVADHLINEYGISFSGFKSELHKTRAPQLGRASSENAVLIKLPNKRGLVPDGFLHSALIIPSEKKAWIRRRGGFIPVEEWYGPLTLKIIDFKGCEVEKYKNNS